MMRDRLIYGSLAVFSAFVGLMLAGGPSALRSAAAPEGGFPLATTVTTTTIAIESSTSEPSVSVTTDADDSIASVATAPDSTAPESSTSTSVEAATTTTTSTAPGTDVPITDVPNTSRERSDLVVAVANGRGSQGAAGLAAARLVEIGYLDPSTRDAPATVTTTVFYADGLEQEASRLAIDVGLAPTAIASVINLPDLEGSDTGFELVLVLGTDIPE